MDCLSGFDLWGSIGLVLFIMVADFALFFGLRHKKIYVANASFVKFGVTTMNIAAVGLVFLISINQAVCR